MLNYKAKLVFFFSGVLSLGLQAQELKTLDGKDLSNCVVYARDAISASGIDTADINGLVEPWDLAPQMKPTIHNYD
jgi:hypothetical protein